MIPSRTTLLPLLMSLAWLCPSVLPAQTAAGPDNYFGKTAAEAGAAAPTPLGPAQPQGNTTHLLTVADDFVVNVYHNGRLVPDQSRKLIHEIFGATVEKIDLAVKPGDWVVFNVVNNRMRWGGAYYFAVAGMEDDKHAIFMSSLTDGRWSCCDDPAKVADFIASPLVEGDPIQPVKRPWSDGKHLMQAHGVENWSGEPVWGTSRNTWVRFVYH